MKNKNFQLLHLLINSTEIFFPPAADWKTHTMNGIDYESHTYMWETAKVNMYERVIKHKLNTEEKLEEKIHLLIFNKNKSWRFLIVCETV